MDDTQANAKDSCHQRGNDHRPDDHCRAVHQQAESSNGRCKTDQHKKVGTRARPPPHLAVGLDAFIYRQVILYARQDKLCLAQEGLERPGAATDDDRRYGRLGGDGLRHVAKQLAVDVAFVAGPNEQGVVPCCRL